LYRTARPGDGSQRAGWHFDGLPPGRYDVQVTWAPHCQRATNAPYSLFDGPAFLAKVRVNQQLAPYGTTVHDAVYQSLGHFEVQSGVLRVELSNEANNLVVADSVRVVEVPAEGFHVLDDGQPGYHEEGGAWTSHWNGGGYGNRYSFVPGGDGAQAAAWCADGLPAGEYDVQVSWVAHSDRARNAPYALYDGPHLLATVPVNQQREPVGTAVNGVIFQSLGKFPVQSGTLRLVLSNDADGTVVADAVHVLPTPAKQPMLLKLDQPGYYETGPRWAA
jgi:hypothetical protein